jgi:hypothetical protein
MSALPDHVEISKNELRAKAIRFVKNFANAKSEAAEKQTFWNEFFDIFGISTRSVGSYEVLAKRLSTGGRGFIDFLYPGEMAIEQKSLGENLDKAMAQLIDYLDSLQDIAMPRLLIASDFQNFYWKDLANRSEGRFALSELPKYLEMFWWLAGYRSFELEHDEEEANLVATDFMAKLHDAVMDSGYSPHALREWLTRILFCLFADDTQVWDRNAFTSYIYLHTRDDGSDLGPALAHLFQILNTPEDKRSKTLDEDLAVFTYINGDLFEENLPIPSCDPATRNALLHACQFNWSSISPAIFGSMFMNVMTPAERRELGAHYTSEENILKTIRPLFVDELEEELKQANSRITLDRLHDKLANLTFLDPACGCGNFLVIAYRELRRLESELWAKRMVVTKQTGMTVFDVAQVCRLTVNQFYGIEIEEFPARIARTALYLMDHKSNLEFSKQFGQYFVRFPIPASPHIRVGNALRFDWNDHLPADRANYVFGNPPFVGSRLATPEQKEDQALVWAGEKRQGTLDYVTNWFKVAAEYAEHSEIRMAFVSTNSITQGEQPSTLWRELWKLGMTIDFAYRTFAWTSEAKGKAAVHVVIIGFSGATKHPKPLLWLYADINGPGHCIEPKQINPYLLDAPNLVIGSRQQPLDESTPPMFFGSMPRDNGHLSKIAPVEAQRIRETDSIAAKYLRRLIGADEVLNGAERYCLWLVDAEPRDIAESPVLRERLNAVREMRLDSKAASTRKFAATPGLFAQLAQPTVRYLAIPRHSSESRDYFPTAFYEADVIASDALLTIPGANLELFGVLSSKMFTAWNKTISGRIKSDVRVSQEITYNNFPFLVFEDEPNPKVAEDAQCVLDARSHFPEASLAELYDPIGMPPELVKAHNSLDMVVDAYFFPRRKFTIEAERVAALFERYDTLSSPLFATGKTKRKR